MTCAHLRDWDQCVVLQIKRLMLLTVVALILVIVHGGPKTWDHKVMAIILSNVSCIMCLIFTVKLRTCKMLHENQQRSVNRAVKNWNLWTDCTSEQTQYCHVCDCFPDDCLHHCMILLLCRHSNATPCSTSCSCLCVKLLPVPPPSYSPSLNSILGLVGILLCI